MATTETASLFKNRWIWGRCCLKCGKAISRFLNYCTGCGKDLRSQDNKGLSLLLMELWVCNSCQGSYIKELEVCPRDKEGTQQGAAMALTPADLFRWQHENCKGWNLVEWPGNKCQNPDCGGTGEVDLAKCSLGSYLWRCHAHERYNSWYSITCEKKKCKISRPDRRENSVHGEDKSNWYIQDTRWKCNQEGCEGFNAVHETQCRRGHSRPTLLPGGYGFAGEDLLRWRVNRFHAGKSNTQPSESPTVVWCYDIPEIVTATEDSEEEKDEESKELAPELPLSGEAGDESEAEASGLSVAEDTNDENMDDENMDDENMDDENMDDENMDDESEASVSGLSVVED